MADDKDYPEFSESKIPIGEVAKMFGVCIRTIRIYEHEGLLTTKRSSGNHRLFGKEDFEIIGAIIFLARELKINLAGIKVIFAILRMFKVSEDMFIKTIKKSINADV